MSQARSAGVSARAYDPSWKGRVTLPLATALVATLMLVWGGPASAQQAKCLAGKTKLHGQEGGRGLLKCEALAETPGKPADPNARRVRHQGQGQVRRRSRADQGLLREAREQEPERLHHARRHRRGRDGGRQPASRRSSRPSIRRRSIRRSAAPARRSARRSTWPGSSSAARLAQTPGKPTDPNTNGCVDKAVAKYTGGVDPRRAASRSSRRRTRTTVRAPAPRSRCRVWRRTASTTSSPSAPARRPRTTTTTTSDDHHHHPSRVPWTSCRARSRRRPAASTTT